MREVQVSLYRFHFQHSGLLTEEIFRETRQKDISWPNVFERRCGVGVGPSRNGGASRAAAWWDDELQLLRRF